VDQATGADITEQVGARRPREEGEGGDRGDRGPRRDRGGERGFRPRREGGNDRDVAE
jgi:polyribonucleotide nucleotidyltransferase